MRTTHGQTDPSSCASFVTFCWQREFDVKSPYIWRYILTFGMDLLGIMKLESTMVREITDGSNLREEQSDEPRHVLKDSTME